MKGLLICIIEKNTLLDQLLLVHRWPLRRRHIVLSIGNTFLSISKGVNKWLC